MSDTLIVLHTAIAIIVIVLLIVVAKVDPVISLVIGTLYLGVAAGLGFEDTIGTFVQGFGDIMAEVGLLIGFGVLMGTLLTAMGALQKLVELLLRILGPRRLPYAFSAALTTIFPAIYVDVQLVLASPLARSAAPRMGHNGLGMMGGTLTAGILVGYVFVVPGLGTVAIAGLLDVPLGTMLIYGTVIGLPTAVLTTFIYGQILKRGLWNNAKDEAHFEDMVLGSPDAVAEEVREEGRDAATPEGDPSVAEDARKGTPAATTDSAPFPTIIRLAVAHRGCAVADSLRGDRRGRRCKVPCDSVPWGSRLRPLLRLTRRLPAGVAYANQRARRRSDAQGFQRDRPDPADYGHRGLFGSGDRRDRARQNPWGILLGRGGHAGSANDFISLVDCGHFAPCHWFDLSRRHHRSRHTGPDIG
jgi:hypothetical protein